MAQPTRITTSRPHPTRWRPGPIRGLQRRSTASMPLAVAIRRKGILPDRVRQPARGGTTSR